MTVTVVVVVVVVVKTAALRATAPPYIPPGRSGI